jgi:folate-binding protein YgfZ
MTDASLINPLYPVHQQAEAEFQPYADIDIVSTFGEPQAEYAAIRKACGLLDLPQRAVIELTGADRLSFLNNLLTNQTWDKQTRQPIPPGQVVYAFLLNAKTGRIITDVNVLELGERTLLEVEVRLVPTVMAALEKYLFGEKVQIANRLGELHEIALYGPGAAAVVNQSLDTPIELSGPMTCAAARTQNQDVIVWRDDPCGVSGFHLIVPTAAARSIWMHLLTRFASGADVGKRPLRPVGWAALNTTRIEAGRPLFGIDFDDATLPAETGPLLNRAVSFTKGCYPGQEVVARMHARHQVARQIAGIRMEGPALPIAGGQVFDAEQNVVGAITSSTISPVLSGAAITLGMVKRPLFNVGSALRIPAEGAVHDARVVELPFLARAIEETRT